VAAAVIAIPDYNPHSGLLSTPAAISPRLPSWDEPALDSGHHHFEDVQVDRFIIPSAAGLPLN